jgi:hypothetical protein
LQSETTCEMNQFTPLINLSWFTSNLTSTFFFPSYTQVKTWKWTCTKVCTRNLFSSLIGSNLFLPQWCTQDLLLLNDQKKWYAQKPNKKALIYNINIEEKLLSKMLKSMHEKLCSICFIHDGSNQCWAVLSFSKKEPVGKGQVYGPLTSSF